MFCQPFNREIGAVICNNLRFILSTDFNCPNVAFDFWVCFNQIFNFNLILNTKCRNENEIDVFFMMIGDSGAKVVCMPELNQFLVIGVGIVDCSKINTFGIHGELGNERFFNCTPLFLFQGIGRNS